MRLFVTGATGYLGGAVVKALLPDDQLRLLVRSSKGVRRVLSDPGIEIVEGDLLVQSSWEEALKGCDGVAHLAALVQQGASPRQFFAVNCDAFHHLADLCWKKGMETFLYASSFIALGPTEPGANQSLWRANPYAESKRRSLALARDYQKKGFPITTLIPTVLYGPGVRTEGNHVSPLLERLLRDRSILLPDRGKWIWNFSFIDDVAQGFRLALENGKGKEEYLLGGVSLSLEQFFASAARLLGKNWETRSVSAGILKGCAVLEELIACVTRRPPRLTRAALSVYRHDWDYRDKKAREELGYRTVSLEEGLKRTLDWLAEG